MPLKLMMRYARLLHLLYNLCATLKTCICFDIYPCRFLVVRLSRLIAFRVKL